MTSYCRLRVLRDVQDTVPVALNASQAVGGVVGEPLAVGDIAELMIARHKLEAGDPPAVPFGASGLPQRASG